MDDFTQLLHFGVTDNIFFIKKKWRRSTILWKKSQQTLVRKKFELGENKLTKKKQSNNETNTTKKVKE